MMDESNAEKSDGESVKYKRLDTYETNGNMDDKTDTGVKFDPDVNNGNQLKVNDSDSKGSDESEGIDVIALTW